MQGDIEDRAQRVYDAYCRVLNEKSHGSFQGLWEEFNLYTMELSDESGLPPMEYPRRLPETQHTKHYLQMALSNTAIWSLQQHADDATLNEINTTQGELRGILRDLQDPHMEYKDLEKIAGGLAKNGEFGSLRTAMQFAMDYEIDE